MQDASLGSASRTIKRAIYASIAFVGIVVWSYYSGIGTYCMRIEGAVIDCTDYAVEAAEMMGIILTGLGIGLFVLSFFKGRPGMASWI